MQTNESIIAVPITVEQSGQTRQFLVRLVEKLDIVLGRRGGDPYVSNSQLAKTTAGLTTLEQTVLEIVERLLTTPNSETIATLLAIATEETSGAIDDLKSSSTVSDSTTTLTPISAPPTKGEVEAVDAKLVANAADFNSLLTALRGTGIIAT